MCRLFGMSAGSTPAQATFWLLEAPDSLVEQSHREPDGTGLGWFDERGAPEVYKRPIAAYEDRGFARHAQTVTSRTFVSHIRFASSGDLTLENTHPFEQDGRLFAHNGVIEDMATLEAELGDARELVRGETDSERYFALVTREVERSGGDVSPGIAAAARWIADNLPVFAINCVLVTPEGLWALRYPDTHQLHVLERNARTVLRHESSLGSRVESDHGREHRLVVIASERMDNDPDWRLLDSGELLQVTEQLEVVSERILDRPPKRLLSVEDLSPQAQESQRHPRSAGGRQ
jgi:predicted glutamine amidotransferase